MKINKKLLIVFPVLIAFIVFVVLYLYFNNEDSNSFTVMEKKWLANNSDEIIDFELINNYPVYGENSGVFYSFIDSLESATNLEFNIIPYLKESNPNTKSYRFRILKGDVKLSNNDLFLNEDNYVLISLNNKKINRVSDLKNITLGVFTGDVGDASYYLKTATNITYKTYDDVDNMFLALDKKQINMVLIPNIMYLDKTITSDKYYINYVMTEMKNNIVLTLGDDNEKLNTILTKYYNNWKNNYYVDEYNEKFLDYYVKSNKINDKNRADLLSKTYVYGYVDNYPYEATIDNQLVGISGEYIGRMQRLTNIDFTFKKYKTLSDLKKAIEEKEVDIYFSYFDYDNIGYLATLSPFVEEYVVLGKVSDGYIVNSFEALKDRQIAMVSNNTLHSYFKDNSKAIINEYDNISKLVKNNKNEIIVVDKEVYNIYRNDKFKNYEILYSDSMTNEYTFMIKEGNETFYSLFNYIINSNSYYKYRNNGINSMNVSILDRTTFEQLYIIVLVIVFGVILFGVVLYWLLNRKKKVKEIKKEERRKYTDMLTSLKNRSYLNLNIEAWNNTKKYPQSTVIVDLNNVKYVNDNYGHEAGDQLIVKAASILLNTQLENSEIIRTDGNEFLIYLVGYSEQQVSTYTKKLAKELKTLPYGFGAAIGYSMIVDDIKTIDDAINEAALEMRTDKEEYK